MSQIALPFDWPAQADERDFIVSDANAAAVRQLDHRALWPVQACVLAGPRKSGRSLLGRIFAGRSGGTLIDDADRRPEEELFHAWNRAQSDRRPLLLIAERAPPAWAVRLPDLRSRLAATPSATIAEPDDALATALVERLLGRRGLAASPELLAYLGRRVERSYLGITRLVDALDELALAKRRGVTIPIARAALERVGMAARQEEML